MFTLIPQRICGIRTWCTRFISRLIAGELAEVTCGGRLRWVTGCLSLEMRVMYSGCVSRDVMWNLARGMVSTLVFYGSLHHSRPGSVQVSSSCPQPAPTWSLKSSIRICSHEEPKQKMNITQSYLTICDAIDCSPPDSSVHGIL